MVSIAEMEKRKGMYWQVMDKETNVLFTDVKGIDLFGLPGALEFKQKVKNVKKQHELETYDAPIPLYR